MEGQALTAQIPKSKASESERTTKVDGEPDPAAERLLADMGAVVTRAEIEISNVLYGGDIAVDTPEGRSLQDRHALIIEALEEVFPELDLAYDRLVIANDRFDQAYFELGGRVEPGAAKADWAVGSREVRSSLVEAMMLEQARLRWNPGPSGPVGRFERHPGPVEACRFPPAEIARSVRPGR